MGVVRLRDTLAEWTSRMDGPDVHSISRQLSNMLWWSAFYRAINESRKHLPTDAAGKPVANGSLHGLINDGYRVIHATAIRRLVDKAPYNGPKGVNSLYNFVEDIRDRADLLTRAAVLEARGLTYDYMPNKQQALDEASKDAASKGKKSYYVSRDGWADAEYWHEAWDALCRISPEARTADDCPKGADFGPLLDAMRREANAADEYVNKYIAHAATETSRSSVPAEDLSLSLDKLWRAERTLVRAANFVSRTFCSGAEIVNVPVPQFDQFEHLNEPFATESGIEAMNEAWNAHDKDIESCGGWHLHEPLNGDPPTNLRPPSGTSAGSAGA